MTKRRPYHSQPQGTLERSHSSLGKKITYDLRTQKQARVLWSKNLQNYAKCLNNEKVDELGWKPAFQVYFRRKSNKLL